MAFDNSPQTDPVGRATMSSGIAAAENYHSYIFDTLSRHLVGRVWEIGCGYGQYTQMLLDAGFPVLATDIDRELLNTIAEGPLAGHGSGLTVEQLDLYDAGKIAQCSAWKPASILCLNVLEHIRDDTLCLAELFKAVEKGTRAVFLCPAHQFLYGFMDSEAGHFRRYTTGSLSRAFVDAGWTVKEHFYMNPVGAIGWYVRNKLIPPKSGSLDDPKVNSDIAFFDRYILPISRGLDPITRKIFGQSAVVVAEKV